MDLQKIKKIEKAIVAVATVNKRNQPHNISVACVKIKDEKIILTDNYMKSTVENIKMNPHVSLVFWHGKKDTGLMGKQSTLVLENGQSLLRDWREIKSILLKGP